MSERVGVSSVGVSSVSEVSGVSDVSDRRTCVLGPLDLCPGTAAWVVSERVGVSSVGVSGVSAVSDVSECRSLTLLTLDRHDARISPV